MARTLADILAKLLPQILSPNPAERQTGVMLAELLATRFPNELQDYARPSIQQTIAVMAGRPDSVIAKLDGRQGYYLRPSPSSANESPDVDESSPNTSTTVAESAPDQPIPASSDQDLDALVSQGRIAQEEEKFRAIFARYAETESRYCMVVDHVRARKREAGLDKWKYPDLVELSWDAGELTDDGYRLDPALLDVKRSLGEQPFTLASVELKTRLTTSNFREAFFQCVSNSKWAHKAILAVAEPISEEKLAGELRRLGTSYDVTVISFSLPPGFLAALPDAQKILDMADKDFDSIAVKVDVRTIATGQPRESLDWSFVADMRERSDEFKDIFLWISKCLDLKKVLTFSAYRELSDLERKAQAIATR